MTVRQVIQKVLKSRGTIGGAVAILVVSLGLLCLDPPGRPRGHRCGVGLKLGRCMLGVSSGRGGLSFVAQWDLLSRERNGFYFGMRHPGEYHHGLHFSALGFGFGFLPSRAYGNDFSVLPYIGLSIPLWFTCVAAVGLFPFNWHLRRGTATAPLPEQAASKPVVNGVRHWLLSCSLSFAGAELCWLGGQYVTKYDVLEIPLIAPLLPLVLLLDSREARVSLRDWLPYAAAFWVALFCLSVVLSRRRIHPGISGAVLLAAACLFGVLLAFVAT